MLTGDLTVSGTLTSATTVSNVVNGKFVEVDSELLTQSACSSYFNGPVYCNAGLTGATGAFTSLSVAGDITFGGTSMTTRLDAKQTRINNLTNLLTMSNFPDPIAIPTFTPTDVIAWTALGSATCLDNQVDAIVPNNTVSLLTLNNAWNLYKLVTNNYSGQQLVIKVLVKLGTATNFNISVNNTLAWNTVGGQTFTTANGLNTTSYTLCSYVFTAPSQAGFTLNVGGVSNSQSGLAAQSVGTVFVYGWQILYNNSTTSDITGSLRMPGTLTCSSLMVNSITMPTPAYMRVQLSTATYPASITSDITWTSATASTLVMVSSPGASIRLPAIGVYLIAGKISIQSQITSSCYLQIQTSTDFTSWNYVEYNQVVTLPANGDFQIASYLLPTTVVNQLIKVTIYNTMTSAIIFNSGYSQSFVNVVRIA